MHNSQASTPRILLVDDAEDSRFLVQRFLRKTPYHVDTAADGLQALSKAENHTYDLILMDINMPVMDGLTATQTIREQERNCDSKPAIIVALTGADRPEDIQACREAGCDRYLAKPLKKKRLLELLDELLVPRKKESAVFKNLLPKYLADRQRDCRTILAAIDTDDFETARLLGHNLKGSGGGYGFGEIARIGGMIEEAAMQEEAEPIRLLVQELALFLKQATDAL